MSDDMKAMLAGVLRHGLTLLAGYLAAKGINLDDTTLQALSTVAVAVLGIGWSLMQKKGKAV
jgi:hypothetical protein